MRRFETTIMRTLARAESLPLKTLCSRLSSVCPMGADTKNPVIPSKNSYQLPLAPFSSGERTEGGHLDCLVIPLGEVDGKDTGALLSGQSGRGLSSELSGDDLGDEPARAGAFQKVGVVSVRLSARGRARGEGRGHTREQRRCMTW